MFSIRACVYIKAHRPQQRRAVHFLVTRYDRCFSEYQKALPEPSKPLLYPPQHSRSGVTQQDRGLEQTLELSDEWYTKPWKTMRPEHRPQGLLEHFQLSSPLSLRDPSSSHLSMVGGDKNQGGLHVLDAQLTIEPF